MNNSVRVAFCGIVTALATILMFITGLIPIGTYALPAIAGVLCMMIVIEMGTKWAWPVYIAVSILSLLVAPDKEAAVLYVLFFGYYPIIKALLERITNKALVYLSKFTVFNIAMVLDFFITITLLGVPKESFTIYGIYLPWAFLILGNLVFIVYDYSLSGLVIFYFQRFHRTVSKLLHTK